jgi:hypothetical protein
MRLFKAKPVCLLFLIKLNRNGGVMLSILVYSVVDHGLESGQVKPMTTKFGWLVYGV